MGFFAYLVKGIANICPTVYNIEVAGNDRKVTQGRDINEA